MENKKESFAYRVIYFLVKLFYPKLHISGAENIPEEACVIVGNHTQINGPIAGEIYTPVPHYIWCAGQMMNREEVADYAFTDFWSFKPKWTHPFFRLLSKLIVPLAVCIFNGAHTVPVYHDSRLITTYRRSVSLLSEGYSMVIYPEYNKLYNNILYDFQDKFIDVARFYFKKAGKAISFVPVYIAPKLKTMYYGKPTRFDPAAPIAEERARICRYLMDEITNMAASLPKHTVVPYRNIRKKDYPVNTPVEVYQV